MGFFSQDCIATDCGHPALCSSATNAINAWMSRVVSISPSGDIHIGEYDGYGTVASAEMAVGQDNTIWHEACWEVAGKPLEFRGESPGSPDQGWFFDEADHDKVDPRKGRGR